jgi:hypothetical protein
MSKTLRTSVSLSIPTNNFNKIFIIEIIILHSEQLLSSLKVIIYIVTEGESTILSFELRQPSSNNGLDSIRQVVAEDLHYGSPEFTRVLLRSTIKSYLAYLC